jgi:hypothetical protein
MAKARHPGGALFTVEHQRRHAHLILPKLLTEKSKGFYFKDDQGRLSAGLEALSRWAELALAGALEQKETSLDSEFLRVIFGQALGYKTVSEDPEAYTMVKNPTVTGAGQADGALGFFSAGQDVAPTVVIECKDVTTDLDHDKFNGRTPVQQLGDYMAQLPQTPWGILTNYLTVRLYHRNSPMRAYQEFTVADFKDPDKGRDFLYLFEPDGLLGRPPLQRPRALDLLGQSDQQRLTVGDRLYDYYSEQRLCLIDMLVSEHGYSTDDAIHAAQRLLDRIVFIAFCEDRGLLPPKLIDQTWASVPPLARDGERWRRFLDMFHFIDQGHKALDLPHGYNGGLFRFDPLVDDLKLVDEDDRWTQVFKTIAGYDFRDEGEISVDVLGHLFEKSINELEKLRVLGLFGRQTGSECEPAMPKSAIRKRFGIYYTPPTFTRFIVENTVGQLIAERVESLDDPAARIEALRKLRVLDPACGSGAFLIAAYEAFEAAYEAVLYRLRDAGQTEEAQHVRREFPEWILADNLFGVDLSRESVEITQLALWIRSARKGKTLSDLSRNIICGNSLVADVAVHERALDWRATFPHVFEAGGFDCVIGNPPWERLKLQEREFFALSAPRIASAVNAAQRRALIESLASQDAELHARYTAAKEAAEKTLAHVRQCGRYPHTGRGDVNTYMLFAELARQLVAPDGLAGLLVPSGIATDETTRHFFADLMANKALAGLYDFENRDRVFRDVDSRFKFSVLLMTGSGRQVETADFVFFARNMDDLDKRDRHIKLSARDLKLLNPNTRTCPIFRTRRDSELTKRIYRNIPILIDRGRKKGGNPWELRFFTMFHQTNDAELFRDAKDLQSEGLKLEGNRWVRGKQTYLPVYEAKMIQAFDHRAAGVVVADGNWMRQGQTEQTPPVYHQNPEFVPTPRFWVREDEVLNRRGERKEAFLALKDVTSPTNQRTMIAAFIPWAGVMNSAPLILTTNGLTYRRWACLLGNLNSFAYDFVARQKVGGLHLNFFIVEQLPTLPPERYEEKCPWSPRVSLEKWISDRVLKLTCTAEDMLPLAKAAGFKEGVHKWHEGERAQLRAELDAAYFRLYGLDRDDVNYVLDQFQGVVREDHAHGGPGPTRRAILEALDALET